MYSAQNGQLGGKFGEGFKKPANQIFNFQIL